MGKNEIEDVEFHFVVFFLQNWKEEDFDFPDGYIWDISSNLYTYINIKRYFYQRQLHLFHLVCVCVCFINCLYFLNEYILVVYIMGTFRWPVTLKGVDLDDLQFPIFDKRSKYAIWRKLTILALQLCINSSTIFVPIGKQVLKHINTIINGSRGFKQF